MLQLFTFWYFWSQDPFSTAATGQQLSIRIEACLIFSEVCLYFSRSPASIINPSTLKIKIFPGGSLSHLSNVNGGCKFPWLPTLCNCSGHIFPPLFSVKIETQVLESRKTFSPEYLFFFFFYFNWFMMAVATVKWMKSNIIASQWYHLKQGFILCVP